METKEEKYIRVKQHVKKVRKLYSKILNALMVISIVAAVNYYVNEFQNPWVLWIIGFSVLGIVIQMFKVYGPSLLFGKGWEQRKIREHMEKEEKRE